MADEVEVGWSSAHDAVAAPREPAAVGANRAAEETQSPRGNPVARIISSNAPSDPSLNRTPVSGERRRHRLAPGSSGAHGVGQGQADERDLRARRANRRREHARSAQPRDHRRELLHQRARQRDQHDRYVLNRNTQRSDGARRPRHYARRASPRRRLARARPRSRRPNCRRRRSGRACPSSIDGGRPPVFDAVDHAPAEPVAAGNRRHVRVGDDARRDDERRWAWIAGPRAPFEAPLAVLPRRARHLDAGVDRQPESIGVAVEIVEEVAARQEESARRWQRQAGKRGQVPPGVQHQAVVQVAPTCRRPGRRARARGARRRRGSARATWRARRARRRRR